VTVRDLAEAARAKQAVRELAWTRLREAGAARFPGARGRIPNFIGAEAAAGHPVGLPRPGEDRRRPGAGRVAPRRLSVHERSVGTGTACASTAAASAAVNASPSAVQSSIGG
jgi:hypothetical protein